MSIKTVRAALATCAVAVIAMTVPARAVPGNAFYLRNASHKTLHFQYGCDGGKLYSKTIPPERGYSYWVRNGCTDYTIRKTTDLRDGETKTFTYDLTAGHRYEIYWDRAKGAWNIREL